ncbi:hypothetical protein BpHYR1_044148 [Brachionus plicatilis]|uniref:Uncharacterized protein n=1 Tax=Brachionus plicatilis TaxID=10195 RepID=A0A3M7Q3J2_BRAPC|nr:hypothetical protein BpHYR1_044148 [Brachionus plicatilis]
MEGLGGGNLIVLNEVKERCESHSFLTAQKKGSFYKEIALVTVESSNAAKLDAKKALSKQSKAKLF